MALDASDVTGGEEDRDRICRRALCRSTSIAVLTVMWYSRCWCGLARLLPARINVTRRLAPQGASAGVDNRRR